MLQRTFYDAIWFGAMLIGLMLWSPLAGAQAPPRQQTQAQTQQQIQEGTRQQSEQRMQQRQQLSWEQQAEQTFGLGRGTGRQLMTQEEWEAHHRAMQQMTAEERERYRQEWHSTLQQRAQERGLTMPDTPRQSAPGPHERGPGGAGGMGGRGR